MSSEGRDDLRLLGSTGEETDCAPADLGFGEGGVPWYLLMLYLGFLVFFTWYVIEYQLPEFLDQGPVPIESGGSPPPK
jgi:hypothetical protein